MMLPVSIEHAFSHVVTAAVSDDRGIGQQAVHRAVVGSRTQRKLARDEVRLIPQLPCLIALAALAVLASAVFSPTGTGGAR